VPSDFVASAWRGDADRHRVGCTATGQWWWVPPGEEPIWAAGVLGASRVTPGLPQLRDLTKDGFNLLGWDAPEKCRHQGVPHLLHLDLRRAGGVLFRLGGVQVPDVFDTRWEAACRAQVADVSCRDVAGWVSDDELDWGQPPLEGTVRRPTLLQVCLSLDPNFAAYHAAWEYVLAPRGGDLARLAADWGVELPNKQTLRVMTQEDRPLDSPPYRDDHDRFSQEFVQRYFRVATTLVREIDPGALWLGPVVESGVPGWLRDLVRHQVDVMLVREPWAQAGPQLVVGMRFSGREAPEAAADDPPLLGRLEGQLRRGRERLTALLRQPDVVGYLWEPTGFDYPMGGEALAAINQGGAAWRAAQVQPGGPAGG